MDIKKMSVSLDGPRAEIREASDNKWVIVTRVAGQCVALVLFRDEVGKLSVGEPCLVHAS